MPSLPPPRTTELYYDGAWHTISGDMRESDPVVITRGVPAIGALATPTAATATLDNRSGRYSPRNPTSPLYGLIGRNTPWRFSVDAGPPHLALRSGLHSVSTPHTASLATTGDIDVRMDAALDAWGGAQMLAIRWAPGGNLGWALEMGQDRKLIFLWSPTGLAAQQRYAVATAPVPANPGERMSVRVTLDVNNGAGGAAVTFYIAARTDRWTVLGAPVVLSGPTSLYAATAPLYLGDNALSLTPDGTSGLSRLQGRVYSLQVRNGIDGPLVADVDPAGQAAAGDNSFTDGAGLVWTLTGNAALSNRHVRLEGEIPAWPPSRDLSGADRTVRIAPAGILRRLGSGTRPLDSALRRHIIGNQPVECWPLTDGKSATRGASLFGSPAIVPAADEKQPLWGDGELASWIEPVLRGGPGTYGTLPAVPRQTGQSASWSVDWVRTGRGYSERVEIYDQGRGTTADPRIGWLLYLQAVPDRIMIFQETKDDTGIGIPAFLGTVTAPGIFDGRMHHLRMRTVVFTSDTYWALYVDGVILASGTQPVVGRAVARINLMWDMQDASNPQVDLGYLTYWNANGPAAATVYQAARGFPGESAGARMLRLSAENGVPASLVGLAAPTDSTPLGVQQPERYLAALTTLAKADLGMVLEQRDARALIYRSRTTLYNQLPLLTLDFAAGEISDPFDPVDDDKLTENDITVRRRDGAEHTAVLEQGPLSVADIGRYDVSPELSLATDTQAVHQAWWRLHVGTFNGLRYTKITVDLANARAYALAADILRVDAGDKIRLRNLPRDQAPGDVDLIVTGYTEEIGSTAWKISFTCVPGEPWTVGVVGDPVLGRADTDGSELAAAVSATATTWSVKVTAGPLWITTATRPLEFPVSVTCGGEEITVTAITGTSSPQTWTVIRSANGIVKPHPAGVPLSLTHPMRAAL